MQTIKKHRLSQILYSYLKCIMKNEHQPWEIKSVKLKFKPGFLLKSSFQTL